MNGDAEEREKKCRARVLLLWWPNGIRTRVWSRPRFRQTFQPFLGPGDSKKYDRTQTRTIAFLKAFTRRDQDSAPIRFGRALQFDATTLHPSVLRRSKRDSFVMAWPSLRLCRSGSPSLRPTITLVSRAGVSRRMRFRSSAPAGRRSYNFPLPRRLEIGQQLDSALIVSSRNPAPEHVGFAELTHFPRSSAIHASGTTFAVHGPRGGRSTTGSAEARVPLLVCWGGALFCFGHSRRAW